MRRWIALQTVNTQFSLPIPLFVPANGTWPYVRQVAMDCTEVDEGYKVRYTPLSPGHYYVGVKYDGYHIAGSPFKVDVEGRYRGT